MLNSLKGLFSSSPQTPEGVVLIPEGKFVMGNNESYSEKPQHEVYLDAYYIDIFPVTVRQYRQFCESANVQMPKPPDWGWHDDHPIVNVNWFDASAYAKWKGKHLPTEAQWEKAARGTDGRRFPWGNEWDWNNLKCHCSSLGHWADVGGTAPVTQYPEGTSSFGVYDMAGNVREWCADWFAFYFDQNAPSRNPEGPDTGTRRVLRGGCWEYNRDYMFECSCRGNAGFPEFGKRNYGFRCVLALK
jgi:sulfatase modifying factor 1